MASTNTSGRNGGVFWTKSIVLTGATGDPVYIDRWPCSVAVTPAGGASGKVQLTLSSHAEINAGTANWHDWSAGVVSAATVSFMQGPGTGVRVVSSSGTCTMDVAEAI